MARGAVLLFSLRRRQQEKDRGRTSDAAKSRAESAHQPEENAIEDGRADFQPVVEEHKVGGKQDQHCAERPHQQLFRQHQREADPDRKGGIISGQQRQDQPDVDVAAVPDRYKSSHRRGAESRNGDSRIIAAEQQRKKGHAEDGKPKSRDRLDYAAADAAEEKQQALQSHFAAFSASICETRSMRR